MKAAVDCEKFPFFENNDILLPCYLWDRIRRAQRFLVFCLQILGRWIRKTVVCHLSGSRFLCGSNRVLGSCPGIIRGTSMKSNCCSSKRPSLPSRFLAYCFTFSMMNLCAIYPVFYEKCLTVLLANPAWGFS